MPESNKSQNVNIREDLSTETKVLSDPTYPPPLPQITNHAPYKPHPSKNSQRIKLYGLKSDQL
jgi:hypothetical protein